MGRHKKGKSIPVRIGENWTGPVVGEVTAVEEDEQGIKATIRVHDTAAVERYFGSPESSGAFPASPWAS